MTTKPYTVKDRATLEALEIENRNLKAAAKIAIQAGESLKDELAAAKPNCKECAEYRKRQEQDKELQRIFKQEAHRD